eukprot:SAG31_NODE_20046_length_585_cov_0.847737_1_plen_39_part_10
MVAFHKDLQRFYASNHGGLNEYVHDRKGGDHSWALRNPD